MTIRIELTRETRDLLREAKRKYDRDYVLGKVLEQFEKQAFRIAGHISSQYLRGQRLNVRTGTLARSIVGTSAIVKGAPAIRIGVIRGPALAYAGVQEYGTRGRNPSSPYDTIRPIRGRYLAMPVGKSLTPAGVPRYDSPRQYPGSLSFVPFRRGTIAKGALYPAADLKRVAASAELTLRDIEPAFLLLTHVDIAPHWYLRDGMQSQLPRVVKDLGILLGDIVGLAV